MLSLLKCNIYSQSMIQQLNDPFQQRCQMQCNSATQTSHIEVEARSMEANTKT